MSSLANSSIKFKTMMHSSSNTILLICSDNGPAQGAGVAGPFRGYKTHLYEGGIRSSLIAWGPGWIKAKGAVNKSSVFSAIDLVPTLLDLTGINPPPDANFDGEVVTATLLGTGDASRKQPIFFRRPPDRNAYYGVDNLPDLAVRSGKWKFLCEYDGRRPELYDMETDRGETSNVADRYPDVVSTLTPPLLAWHKSMPTDNGATYSEPKKKKRSPKKR